MNTPLRFTRCQSFQRAARGFSALAWHDIDRAASNSLPMKSIHYLLTTLLVLSTSLSSGAEVPITANGQPKAVIVLSKDIQPSSVPVKALVSHIKQISGATLAVIPEKDAKIEDGRVVVSGAESVVLLGEGELTKQLGITLDGLGAGGIVVQTKGNALALLAKDDGSDSRGPASARPVFAFLETLGCRSLWPGELGKVVPHKSTLTVGDLNLRFTPSIGQRKFRFLPRGPHNFEDGLAWLGLDEAGHTAAMQKAQRVEAVGEWSAWNGLGGNIQIQGGHAGYGLRGGWTEHGKAHPEWFALQQDGTRDQQNAKERWRLCVSNPELIEHVAQDILGQLQGKAKPALSLSPNDGGYSSICMCEACKKLDPPDGPKIALRMFDKVGQGRGPTIDYVSLTDRHVHYWNAAVERVVKVVPDQLFIIDAYSYYSDPPVRERLHPNIIVRYVPSDLEGWKGWRAAGAARIYWRPNNLHGGYRDGVLKPAARGVAEAIRTLAADGMLATDMQGIYHNWATQGLEYWVAARMSWDPSQSFEALLEDYCQSGFGAGAASIRRYFLLVEEGVVPVKVGQRGKFPKLAPGTIAGLRAELVAAAKATEQDAPARRRVAFLRAGLEFTALSAELHGMAEAAGNGEPEKAAAVLLDRRWQMMRAIAQQQPLAINVALVAGHDGELNRALKWKGPGAEGKAGKFQLPSGDDWLYDDQSATRK